MTMTQPPQTVRRWYNVTPAVFAQEIATQYQPAILCGVVRHWPAVRAALQSDYAVCHYLHALDSGKPVEAIMTPPQERGRIFYNSTQTGFNFLRNQVPLTKVMEQVLRYAQFETPPAVAVQSAWVPDCLPGLHATHSLPVLPASVQARIWLGNRITTPAHIDGSDNIACVVSGKRRFTLFPPAQYRNLYLGPLDLTPTGSPISLVDFDQPDWARFPQFKQALESALVADLEPGDAIYIPTLWWHHVRSLSTLNILLNYWWQADPAQAQFASVFDALLHKLHVADTPATPSGP